MRKYLLFFVMLVTVLSVAASSAFAQGDTKQSAPAAAAPAAAAPVAAPAAKEEAAKPAEMSIYGEVQSVNAQASSMTVQYYDYDNDEERSVEITLDSASKLDNAKAIGDIKKGDWVDVSYVMSSGKNVAKAVSVEKEELATDENAPTASE
jgi:hypothetical protein